MEHIELVDEYPLPLDRDGIRKIQQEAFQSEHGTIQSEGEIIEGVDEFHDKWVDELVRTDEWVFFTCEWESVSGWVYVWNHRVRYGFKFREDSETAPTLVDAFDQFANDIDRPETYEKGVRNERQARRILNRKYTAERVPSIYGNNDPFRLADVMGIAHGLPFILIQVKTNGFSAKEQRYYRKWAKRRVDGTHTMFEVWVRIDRNGWKMYRLDPQTWEYEIYFETTTCDPSDVRDNWADAFERSIEIGTDSE